MTTPAAGPALGRTDPPLRADERAMLAAWLDFHRATLELKCAGVEPAGLRERLRGHPSPLSLLGLVRHLAEVERGWFQRRVLGADAPPLYCSTDDQDGDFDNVAGADIDGTFATWRAECARSREVLAGVDSLDATFEGRGGEPISLRWLAVHMIEEYARHNGHADLLREQLDGVTGE